MALDRFEVLINPSQYIHWPGGGGFQPIELQVNGVALITIVREAELPQAFKEYDARLAAGETPADLGLRGALAGDYIYPDERNVLFRHRICSVSRTIMGLL